MCRRNKKKIEIKIIAQKTLILIKYVSHTCLFHQQCAHLCSLNHNKKKFFLHAIELVLATFCFFFFFPSLNFIPILVSKNQRKYKYRDIDRENNNNNNKTNLKQEKCHKFFSPRNRETEWPQGINVYVICCVGFMTEPAIFGNKSQI